MPYTRHSMLLTIPIGQSAWWPWVGLCFPLLLIGLGWLGKSRRATAPASTLYRVINVLRPGILILVTLPLLHLTLWRQIPQFMFVVALTVTWLWLTWLPWPVMANRRVLFRTQYSTW